METSRESLKRTVDLIKNRSATKGMASTAEEMARELGVPTEQFYAYLNGQEETPVDLPSRLRSAYHIRTFIVESVQLMDVHRPESRQDRSENNSGSLKPAGLPDSIRQENNRTSLKYTVVLIRNRGLAEGMNITVEEMAGKTGISGEQLYAYLHDEKDAPPDDLYSILRSAYADLLKNIEKVEIIEDIHMISAQLPEGKNGYR